MARRAENKRERESGSFHIFVPSRLVERTTNGSSEVYTILMMSGNRMLLLAGWLLEIPAKKASPDGRTVTSSAHASHLSPPRMEHVHCRRWPQNNNNNKKIKITTAWKVPNRSCLLMTGSRKDTSATINAVDDDGTGHAGCMLDLLSAHRSNLLNGSVYITPSRERERQQQMLVAAS